MIRNIEGDKPPCAGFAMLVAGPKGLKAPWEFVGGADSPLTEGAETD